MKEHIFQNCKKHTSIRFYIFLAVAETENHVKIPLLFLKKEVFVKFSQSTYYILEMFQEHDSSIITKVTIIPTEVSLKTP